MNPIQRFLSNTLNRFWPSRQLQAAPSNNEKRKGLLWRINRQYTIYNTVLEMQRWHDALLAAENVLRPDRRPLYALYKGVVRDCHLRSQLRTAKIKVTSAPFEVRVNGVANEELHRLFETPWFKQFLEHSLDSEFWGHSLIEFSGKDKAIEKVTLIPRDHVIPEFGTVRINQYDYEGIPYRNITEFQGILLEIGEPDNLGILESACREAIWKLYSRTDWARRSEKFGMPMVIAKTQSRDKTELDAKEEALANMGSNGYAILDDGDEWDLLEPSSGTNAHAIYKEKADFCNAEMSKLISGQTGTADEKAFVGGAQVHERLLEEYTLSRLSTQQDYINFTLIPFMANYWGYTELIGAKVVFPDLEKQPKAATTPPEAPQNTPGTSKKGKALSLATKLGANVCPECGEAHTSYQLSGGLEGLLEAAYKRIYNALKKNATSFIDKRLYQATIKELETAIQIGFDTSYDEPDYASIIEQFTANVHVFAAFKCHANIADLIPLLTDAQGKVVTFQKFKEAAQPIMQQYNVSWMEAEYNRAVSSSQMAQKWAGFEANKADLPYLKYLTVRDSHVRDGHRQLDGTIKKVDSEFWDEYYPPLAYNCRCTVIQIDAQGEVEPKAYPDEKAAPLEFRFNPAKTGEIFSDKHSYFTRFNEENQKRIRDSIKAMNSK